jgi:hypothetical protein
MTSDTSENSEAVESHDDTTVDAICALVIILTLAGGFLYHVWVSGL